MNSKHNKFPYKLKSNFLIILLLLTCIFIPTYFSFSRPDTDSSINETNTINLESSQSLNETIENNVGNISNNNSFLNENNSEIQTASIPEENSAIEPQSLYAVENENIEAYLCATSSYNEGNKVALTQSGITISGWQYDTSKYLQIDPYIKNVGVGTYTIKVILPQEFYVVASKVEAPSGYTNLKFTKNASVSMNGGSYVYPLNTYSGTFEYTLENGTMKSSIQLEIRYDNLLWNREANSSITDDGVCPIIVMLCKDGTEVKRLSVNKVTSGTKLTMGSYYATNTVGTERAYSGTVNALFTQPVVQGYSCVNTTLKRYYKTLTLKVTVPSYTDSSGTKHYLTPDFTKTKPTSNLGKVQYKISSDNILNGTFTITIYNPYYVSGGILNIYYKSIDDDLINSSLNTFTFSGTTINAVANDTYNLGTTTFGTIVFNRYATPNIVFSNRNCTISTNKRPTETVSVLGGFTLANKGTGDSCAKTIKMIFDSSNNNIIKVTAVNILEDHDQEYIIVKYTLIDDDYNKVYLDSSGNRVSGSSSGAIGEFTYSVKNSYYKTRDKDNLNFVLRRDMLPDNQKKYYFKTVEYTINSVYAGAYLYSNGGSNAYTSGGNFMGYLEANLPEGTKCNNTFTLISSDTSISTLTRTGTTIASTLNNPPYQLSGVKLSSRNISAGESLNVSGTISVYDYPYGYCNWLSDIRLGLILPAGISINEDSIVATLSATGARITSFEIVPKSIGNNLTMWIVKFPTDICIGYHSEIFSPISTGRSIDFSIQLNTAYYINNLTLSAKDMIRLAGFKQPNSSSGAMSSTRVTDDYDLNENGLTTDIVAGDNSTTYTCQIVAQSASLDMVNNVVISSNGELSSETRDGKIYTKDDIVTYNLDISCSKGGYVEGFNYFIPIPKKTSGIDSLFVNGSVDNRFTLNLQNAVVLSGTNAYTIKYAFDNGVTYDICRNIENWYTKEQIESNSNLKWEDVTVISIIAKENTIIENGFNTRFSLQMKHNGDNYQQNAGMQAIWKTRGYYHYINNGREMEGNFSTDEIKITMNYKLTLPEITLTAAQNMTPLISGNVNSITVGNGLYDAFIKTQTFSVSSVDIYNVTLQTKEYISSNLDMAGNDANRTFAITVKMESSEYNIIESVKTSPITIGTSSQNTVPKFSYKLYNANALSDNTTVRYILVTLTSNNGVEFKQKININREMAKASDPKSAIVTGKRYVAFDDTTEKITISQDSSFTTQFVIDYIPINYSNHKLNFSKQLPNGTNIILANITNLSNPEYYYYKIQGSDSSISFSNFINMATNSTKGYVELSTTNFIQERLLIIVDFSNCTSYLSESTYSVSITLEGNGIDNLNSKELQFVTKAKRSFSLTVDSNITEGKEFYLKYTTTSPNVAESKYEGRKFSVILGVPDNMPLDSAVQVNDGAYYYLNNKRQFIIPLSEIQAKDSDNIKMKIISNTFPQNSTTYKINTELWVSSTANAEAPMLGEKIAEKQITLTNNKKLLPALKVTKMNKRAIHINELSETLNATFEYKQDTNCKVSIQLQQKDGNGYLRVTDKLSQVNGNTNHTVGVFSLSAVNGTNQVNFKLSSSTSAGTYRLVFEVKDNNNNVLLSVPYNFLVLEN